MSSNSPGFSFICHVNVVGGCCVDVEWFPGIGRDLHEKKQVVTWRSTIALRKSDNNGSCRHETVSRGLNGHFFLPRRHFVRIPPRFFRQVQSFSVFVWKWKLELNSRDIFVRFPLPPGGAGIVVTGGRKTPQGTECVPDWAWPNRRMGVVEASNW